MISYFGCFAAACAVVGIAQQVAGTVLTWRLARSARPGSAGAALGGGALPPVSVMKPLYGQDALTAVALESFFGLDYPEYQLVFGVQNPADPVLEIVRTLIARYPARDVAVVADAALHGANRKVSNLINMLPAVKHGLLVMSDADVHVPPGFLRQVVAALGRKRAGMVTTAYTGRPAVPSLPASLGAAQITYAFLPGALMARFLGRQDGLGVTMALRRDLLAEIGGFEAVKDILADDQVLGRLVTRQGYRVELAAVVPATTVSDSDFPTLFRHELRWARTIRALVPLPYFASILQIPLLWGVVVAACWLGAPWTLGLLAVLFLLRVGCAWLLARVLGLRPDGPALFLLRDLLSVAVFIASYCGDTVHWGGETMLIDGWGTGTARAQPRKPMPVPRDGTARMPQDAGP